MTRIYLPEVAEKLGVQENTIRGWVRKARTTRELMREVGAVGRLPDTYLPETLWPSYEGGRQKLWWHNEQIPGLQKYAEASRGRWNSGPGRTPAKEDYSTFVDFMDREDLIDVPLEDFDLPVRVINTLRRSNIDNVIKLARMSKSDLKKLDNFGQKSIDDVWNKVMDYLAEKDSTVVA